MRLGCLGWIVLTALALMGFGELGWIAMIDGASVWEASFWILLAVLVVDFFSWGVKMLAQILAMPLSFLTGGLTIRVIEGVFKYFGLALASYWTSLFTLPWIFGPLWWQAVIIGFVFAVIAALCADPD